MYDQVTLGLNVDPFILSALKEDITSEDVSTNSVMPHPQAGEVDLICKQDGIICGLQVFERVFTLLDADTKVEFYVKDGDRVANKQLIGKVYGDIRVLLCGERTALNYLQRMSGIATYTSQVAALLEGTGIKLLDTRKTTPNNRIFEKYSVRVGGGNNHRYNLSDGVLLKDNHIGAAGGVKEAIAMAKVYAPFVRKIEVEVESFDMVKDAVEAGADIIMLDNMSTELLKQCIDYIDGRAEIEVSGNVTKENIERIKERARWQINRNIILQLRLPIHQVNRISETHTRSCLQMQSHVIREARDMMYSSRQEQMSTDRRSSSKPRRLESHQRNS